MSAATIIITFTMLLLLLHLKVRHRLRAGWSMPTFSAQSFGIYNYAGCHIVSAWSTDLAFEMSSIDVPPFVIPYG